MIIGGFYRHIYEQKLGPKLLSTSTLTAPDIETTASKTCENVAIDVKTITVNTHLLPHPIKIDRFYRKRQIVDHDIDNSEDEGNKQPKHLQYNLDADSDFSIDSDSEEDEKSKVSDVMPPPNPILSENSNNTDVGKVVNGLEISKKTKDEAELTTLSVLPAENMFPLPPKSKIDSWRKRTVGSFFDDAVQRYFQRKALRSTNG